MKKWIDVDYDIGATVFLKTDEDQRPRIVTGISVRTEGLVMYELAQGSNSTWHYKFEISAEASALVKLADRPD